MRPPLGDQGDNNQGNADPRSAFDTAPHRTPTLRHRHRRLRSARLAQEAEGASGLIFSTQQPGSFAMFAAIGRRSRG
jgi:hypothetical protein